MISSNTAVSPFRTRATISSSESVVTASASIDSAPGFISEQSRDPDGGYKNHFCHAGGISNSVGSEEMKMRQTEVDQSWMAVRVTYGLVPLLAGLDKFFDLLTNWAQYLAPAIVNVLPVSASVFMRTVGVIEIAVGLLILTRWTRIGAYIASAWLVLIALNLVMSGKYFDVAVRDAAMAVGAWTLARLSSVRDPYESRARASERTGNLTARA